MNDVAVHDAVELQTCNIVETANDDANDLTEEDICSPVEPSDDDLIPETPKKISNKPKRSEYHFIVIVGRSTKCMCFLTKTFISKIKNNIVSRGEQWVLWHITFIGVLVTAKPDRVLPYFV